MGSSEQTRLYPLAPIGIGTGRVESLTGYVARLARRHYMSTGRLIQGEIALSLETPDRSSTRRVLARVLGNATTGPIDGSGTRSERWAAILGDLTGQHGLRELTTSSWAAAVGIRDHLRREAAYCPNCLALDLDGIARGLAGPYERLAWRCSGVEVCLLHSTRLLTACMWCDRPRPPLAYWSLPGYCPHCRRWLGVVRESERSAVSAWEIRSAELLDDALGRRIADPDTETIVRGIASIIDATTEGNRMAFARMIGLRSSGTITEWFNGVQPSLGSLLRIAGAVGSDLPSVLDGAPSPGRDKPLEPPRSSRHLRHTPADWAAIELQLAREAAAADPMTLVAVAREHGVRVQDIRNRLPARAKVLVRRGAVARSRQSSKRRHSNETALTKVMADLRREGKAPSRRNIEPRLPDGLSLREPALREVWLRER